MARKITLTGNLTKKYAKKTAKRSQRRVIGRILIVCEGKKTEPNYFNAFKRINNGVYLLDLEVGGGGINTKQVVEEAVRLKVNAEKRKMPYDAVWAVFDRDSFPANNFNSAIAKAEAHGVMSAWSNEAFELWYLLHFEYRDTPMSRVDYGNAIAQHINASPLYTSKKQYSYVKNGKSHYDDMKRYGDLEQAIANATRLDGVYNDARYANHNPRTKVYLLVLQMLGRDEAFNRRISENLR